MSYAIGFKNGQNGFCDPNRTKDELYLAGVADGMLSKESHSISKASSTKRGGWRAAREVPLEMIQEEDSDPVAHIPRAHEDLSDIEGLTQYESNCYPIRESA